ncbi:hypothetical protein P3T76_008752 [Phytophthora citrophthora]|uniref:Uncharacterized protein n=1 Tax=Phytophthora citrophthora TaxID=4793 RepID=A0AAD9LJT1_9STRA|nr:hypothetical protein P3T76_008752 [Phytophthora citrophthora]
MYNIAVASNLNSQLKLRRRSYATLSTKIDALTKSATERENKSSITSVSNLFQLGMPETPTEEVTGNEQAFQIALFRALRQTSGLTKKRQVFTKVYDFASRVCRGIRPKSTSSLFSRWENMKRGSNRGTALKIKIKVP